MNRFAVRIEKFDSPNSYWPFFAKETQEEYYNFYRKPDFKYYFNPRSINGVVIEMDDDVLITKRSIYWMGDLLANVGGFNASVVSLIALFLPFFIPRNVESMLIKHLFKKAPKPNALDSSSSKNEAQIMVDHAAD